MPRHLSPLLNATAEHHLTLGFGWPVSPGWQLDGAFEWDLNNPQRYTNEALPFGADAQEEGDCWPCTCG